MSKSFQLVGLERPVTSTSMHITQTNWKLCIIYQEDKSECLTSPSKSKRKDSESRFSSCAVNLSRFSELGQLPGTLQLERLKEGVALQRPWLQTMFCTIRHANSNITIQNCKEQKSEDSSENRIFGTSHGNTTNSPPL